MTGQLYVVATPIGNLEDMGARARRILSEVSLIAAEDTRHSRKLLSHFGISTRTVALHDHNEQTASNPLLDRVLAGESIALISDAGTPLISDPGFRFVKQARSRGIEVVPVPGASALTAALSASGLPTDRFLFEGFLPAKQGGRQQRIRSLMYESATIVLYEAPHRIGVTLDDLAELLGSNRQAALARELTKVHEQIVTAELGELRQLLADGTIPSKGEMVLLIAGSTGTPGQDLNSLHILKLLLQELPPARAASLTAEITGSSRKELYQFAVQIQKGD